MSQIEFSSITFRDQQFNYTDQELNLPKEVVKKLIGILDHWQHIFPYEPTLAMTTYGVPSFMVRFDGVIDEQGEFQIYEIQEGCGWVGYAGIVNARFCERRNHMRDSVWPTIKLLINRDNDHDDPLWLPKINLDDAFSSDEPLMFRWPVHRSDRSVFNPLLRRSVKPIFTHQDKHYGIDLGLWNIIRWDNGMSEALLPWNSGFALKPFRGYGSRDVMIWKPGNRVGRATRTQILKTLERNQEMYLQKLIEPMHIDLGSMAYNLILRPFFAYDTIKKTWKSMHGVWTARPHPNLRIHGSSDTVSGPLLAEE